MLRTPKVGEYYPTAGVAGRLHLDRGCLSLTWHGRRSIPIWPPSTSWDQLQPSVTMRYEDTTVTYPVGSMISDAGGGYYSELEVDAPTLIGDKVWAEAVSCARKLDADELVLIAPPSP